MSVPRDEGRHAVELGTEIVPILLRRSSRKTLGIVVKPDADVVVTAPEGAPLDHILHQVERKAGWIIQSRREFMLFFPRTPARRFVAGETHYYLGREYRLGIERGPENVRRDGGRLIVVLPDPTRSGAVRAVLTRWYRRMANLVLVERLTTCLNLFAAEGFARPRLSIRRFDKRWGRMSSDGTDMLLNLRLIEADRDEIDYVIIHELCHVVHPNHGVRFIALLDRKLPDWRARKKALETRFA